MDLTDYRKQIDEIDAQLVALFQQRMDVASGVADYKRKHNLPVLDAGREQDKLRDLCSQTRPELQRYTAALYRSIFELSRAHQTHRLGLELEHPSEAEIFFAKLLAQDL